MGKAYTPEDIANTLIGYSGGVLLWPPGINDTEFDIDITPLDHYFRICTIKYTGPATKDGVPVEATYDCRSGVIATGIFPTVLATGNTYEALIRSTEQLNLIIECIIWHLERGRFNEFIRELEADKMLLEKEPGIRRFTEAYREVLGGV